MKRLNDVLFELRDRNLIVNCTNGYDEEFCLYKGLGENIIDVVGKEILLKPIILRRLGNNGEVIITINSIII
jgi:hypothetical protein